MDWFDKYNYELVREKKGSRANYWFNALLTKNLRERDSFLEFTNNSGVMTRPAGTPMHTLNMYSSCSRTELSMTEWLEERIVNIPSGIPS